MNLFGSDCIGIGVSALSLSDGNARNVAIGTTAGATLRNGNSNVFLGHAAGDSSANNVSGRFIVGSSTAPTTQAFIGNGESNVTPLGIVFNATGGFGANVAGASLTLAGGIGTGSGAGGSVIIQTAPASSSSSTPNALANRIVVLGSGLVGVNIDTPVSRLEVAGSYGCAILTITGDTTLDATHYTVLVDASGGDVAVTVPTAASATSTNVGRIYNIKRIDVSANTVTIVPSGGDTFFTTTSGNTSITVAPGTSYQLQANSFGTNWVAI